MRGVLTLATIFGLGALLVASAQAAQSAKSADKPRKPLAFCATAKAKASPACADLPADDRALPPPAAHQADGKSETGKPQVGVRWNASNDARADRNSTTNNVDAINKTIPGAPQGVSDTNLGVGARWKVCLFCE
jgi:hypothetical protein